VTGRLFDMPATRLTDRQRKAHDAIRATGWHGISSSRLGAILHPHGDDQRCEYCNTAGTEVAKALRSKGLVVLRRRHKPDRGFHMVWVDAEAKKPRAPEPDDPFPPGY
jgi:hypothetical protein